MSVQIKILIADDHAVVRHGLKSILLEEWRGAIFGEANNATEVLALLRQDTWDVALLDINMPGRSGLEVLRELRQQRPLMPVLILSMHPEDQYAVRVLKAGAAGYLAKESASEELVRAIRKVLNGGKYVSASLAEKLASGLESDSEKLPHESLSDREFEVLCLIAKGQNPTEIADTLSLSVKTISTFRARILKKMNMKSNAELARYVMQHDLSL